MKLQLRVTFDEIDRQAPHERLPELLTQSLASMLSDIIPKIVARTPTSEEDDLDIYDVGGVMLNVESKQVDLLAEMIPDDISELMEEENE